MSLPAAFGSMSPDAARRARSALTPGWRSPSRSTLTDGTCGQPPRRDDRRIALDRLLGRLRRRRRNRRLGRLRHVDGARGLVEASARTRRAGYRRSARRARLFGRRPAAAPTRPPQPRPRQPGAGEHAPVGAAALCSSRIAHRAPIEHSIWPKLARPLWVFCRGSTARGTNQREGGTKAGVRALLPVQ